MFAAVDAGSNTLRLLIGRVSDGRVLPERYLRHITRLAGGFTPEAGLSPAAMERTLAALSGFAESCADLGVRKIGAVGTAAFRMAVNGQGFAQEIQRRTGIPLEIISGEREAQLMAAGVLSALEPRPGASLIVDIGGGSTELVLVVASEVRWSVSLPLGVVRLTESLPSGEARLFALHSKLEPLGPAIAAACASSGIASGDLALVGTAGTVTTLAAVDMRMSEYDWRRVNGYRMSLQRIDALQAVLAPLSPAERESIPGMEPGRGDLIIAGIDIMRCIMNLLAIKTLTVSDFGILEGLLLAMARDKRRNA